MAFIDIIGGIVLLLLGLRFLRKGFARVFGGDLLAWLQETTQTRPRAFVGGMLAGSVMPSSTAMAFLSVRMTEQRKAPWANVFAVLIGAQVGITILIHVLSFNIGSYSTLFVAMGGGLFLFIENARLRGAGQILLAFGFMLLGMSIISGSARAVAGDPSIENLFNALAALPTLLIFGAILITVLIQSSTAAIAIGIGLASGGDIHPTMLFLWVCGTNIGLCLTVMIAGWSRTEGRPSGSPSCSSSCRLLPSSHSRF